jgi:intracellular sulfur oxidation DsrE/DsrF family protein
MWAKYNLGVYTGLEDVEGKPYTRNVFNRPTTKDLHLLMQSIDSPMIPALADAMPALGIENLQKMGTKFILCANALGIWCLELEARGKGKAQDIEKELRANLLPGVTIVPAMVIAIEKAQEMVSGTTSVTLGRRADLHEQSARAAVGLQQIPYGLSGGRERAASYSSVASPEKRRRRMEIVVYHNVDVKAGVACARTALTESPSFRDLYKLRRSRVEHRMLK